MKKPVTVSLKVLNCMDALSYLSELEAKERGTEYIRGCPEYRDGTKTIKSRLWDMILHDRYGNQQLTNDSFYRWTDPTPYATDPDVLTFIEHFSDSINEPDSEDAYILFEVSW